MRRYGIHNLGVIGLGEMGSGALGGYIQKVLGYGPIAYWPLWETAGTVAQCLVNPAQNGTYARNVTLMGTGTGIGDGNTAPAFDGTNDYVNIYSAALAAAFSPLTGTFAGWARVVPAAWLDGNWHEICMLRSDVNNRIYVPKTNLNNRIRTYYTSGGVTVLQNWFGDGRATWFHVATTWDKPNDEVRLFIAGEQSGATVNGLGVWAGALDANITLLGAGTGPGGPVTESWYGWLSHAQLFSRVLTPTQIRDLAIV